eukprot:1013766_1
MSNPRVSNITHQFLDLFKNESTKIASICGLVGIVVIIGCILSLCIMCKKRKHIKGLSGEETTSWSSEDEDTNNPNKSNKSSKRSVLTLECNPSMKSVDMYEENIAQAIIDLKNEEFKKEMEKDQQDDLDQRFSVHVNDNEDIQII